MNKERVKQSKHYFSIYKGTPYHPIITYLLNFLQLTSNQIKPPTSVSFSTKTAIVFAPGN